MTIAAISSPAHAWDSRTHQTITRLAIMALPKSPLGDVLKHNDGQLEVFSVWPDTVLKQEFGEAEARRHYINLEYFGPDPWAKLDPNLATMEREFGNRRVMMAGTLPWTIAAESAALASKWQANDCAAALEDAGLLSHYVGDASQPLHSTKYYDGFTRADRGVHSRFEGAVDHDIREIERLAAPQVQVEKIESVWTPTLAEIRRASALVAEVVESDRAVRAEGYTGWHGYDQALMNRERSMVARQVADASSILAAIWLYEWERVGSPAKCTSSLMHMRAPEIPRP